MFFLHKVKILKGDKFTKQTEEKLLSFLRRGKEGGKNPCKYH